MFMFTESEPIIWGVLFGHVSWIPKRSVTIIGDVLPVVDKFVIEAFIDVVLNEISNSKGISSASVHFMGSKTIYF